MPTLVMADVCNCNVKTPCNKLCAHTCNCQGTTSNARNNVRISVPPWAIARTDGSNVNNSCIVFLTINSNVMKFAGPKAYVCERICYKYKEAVAKPVRDFITRHFSPNCIRYKLHEDMAKNDNVPDNNLYIAGFLCQGNSISNTSKKPKGMNDPRSGLLTDALAHINAHRPRALLLENVARFVAMNRGYGFQFFETHDKGIGCYDVNINPADPKRSINIMSTLQHGF
jgi:hypothetical protein